MKPGGRALLALPLAALWARAFDALAPPGQWRKVSTVSAAMCA